MQIKLTKYVHSCVLVETPNRVALFDPGIYSWESGVFHLEDVSRIDRIVITHEHADHMHPEFIAAVLQKFTGAHIVCNKSVEQALRAQGISATYRGIETNCVKPAGTASHERLPALDMEPPENTPFHFQGVFTHPGDSHQLQESKEILALPITAPWGSVTSAVMLAQRLQPAYILPIHDWHYNERARSNIYDMLEALFLDSGITFLRPLDGKPITL